MTGAGAVAPAVLRRVAVVGLGCIGGSLAGALRAAAPELELVGVESDPATAAEALARGLVTAVRPLPAAGAWAELVVLCLPIAAMPAALARLGALQPPPLVTDTASTKAAVCGWGAERLGPTGFLGGHPMAGREASGLGAARADLFAGAPWVLTPADASARQRFAPWWTLLERIGARPVELDPASHDEAVAWVSHLPLAVSAALAATVAGALTAAPAAAALAASGYRDATRLAAGRPELSADIGWTNGPRLARALRAVRDSLDELLARLPDRDADAATGEAATLARSRLVEWFAAAQAGRAAVLGPPPPPVPERADAL